MPILSMSIVLGTYATLRVLERRKKHRRNKSKNKQITLLKSTGLTERSAKAHLNLSVVSLATAIIQPAIMPGWGFINAILISFSAYPYIKGFEKSVTDKKITNDVLGASWVILAVSSNQYFAASLGNIVYHIGSGFIARSRSHSRDSMVHIFDQQNRNAWVIKDDVEIEMALNQVMVGDVVAIHSGEMIPVDGKIIYGSARIDQHVLTGESQAVEKVEDDAVYASTLLISGRIHVLVETAGNDTLVAKIETALSQTSDFKSNLQMKGEAWADQSAPYLLGIAGLTALSLGAMPATAVISAQFGYQIRMVAPLSTLQHLSNAMQAGILVKDGRSLETLNDIDTVLFDKTGTLTDEQPQVGQVLVWEGYNEEQVLRLAAISESKLKHPVAVAILQAYTRYGKELPEIEETHYEMGFGVKVYLDGQLIRVGSLRFMENEGLHWDASRQIELTPLYEQGHSVVLVGMDEYIIGAIEIMPTIRAEVPALITGLKQRGIKNLMIVSGDHDEPTRRVAEQLGMEQYFAEVLPTDKAGIVERLQQQGRKICFIGDGINDTIAMKKADVSISLKGASNIATDTADILLMNGNLEQLGLLFDIAKGLNSTMQKSAYMVAMPATIVLVGSIVFHIGLLAAVLVKNGFLGLNVMYVLKRSQETSSINNHSRKA